MGVTQAQALPGEGTVVAGQADIQLSGPGQMLITQGSDRAIINWNNFSIGQGEGVQFLQPGPNALAVNRVTGTDPSAIFGSLTANGQIMLINPNGILFGQASRVDVHSLVATTLDSADEQLLSNDFRFDIVKNPSATVVNRGTITATDGGLVALVAPGVANDGLIQARLGKVALAAADAFSVDLYGDGLVSLPVSSRVAGEIYDAEGQALSAPVSNSGTIRAPGGQVVLAARTAKSMVDDVVNMSGVIEARSVGVRNGVIVLDGGTGNNTGNSTGNGTGGGKVRTAGRMDVSGRAAGEKGGTVRIAGDHIIVESGTLIDAAGDAGGGTVLIGGDYQGGGDMPRAETTIIAAGTHIDASAITSGDGGKVIAWADDQTHFAGTILARGGYFDGHGGLIETSGRGRLSVLPTAFADASAVNGRAGLWLLDPRDVYLRAGSGDDVSGGGVYDPLADDAAVDIDTILTALSGGTSVTITTHDPGGGQSGNIVFENDIHATTAGNATFSLLADNDIVLGGYSVTSTGALNIVMDAGGIIQQTGGSAINSDGGAINLRARDMALGGTMNAGAGVVTLTGLGGQSIALGDGAGDLALSAAELAGITAGGLKIGASDSGAITIGADIAPNATFLHLQSAAGITGTAGGVTAAQLAMQAAGDITLTDSSTAVSTLAVSAAGHNAHFANASGFSIGSVNGVSGFAAGQAVLNAGGAVTQANALLAGTLDITAGGNVTLSHAGNDVASLLISAGAHDVQYRDSSGFTIAGLTADNITLSAGGALTQTGAISAAALGLTAGGNITLINAGNNVAALSVSAAGQAVSFTDADAIELAGITASSFALGAGGAVTDSAATTVNALSVAAGGSITLDHAGNDATTIAMDAGANNITYTDASGVDIGTAGGLSGLDAATVSLQVGGALTDSAASAISGLLSIQAGAQAVTLDQAGNAFGVLSAVSASNLTVANLGSLVLGPATLTGALNAQVNNGLSVTGNVSAAGGVTIDTDLDNNGTGDLTVNGGATLSSGNAAMSITANDIALSGALSSGSGQTTLLVSDGAAIDLGSGGTGGFNLGAAEISAISAGILKIGDATAGAITISSDITPGAAALHLHSGATITGTAGGVIAGALALQAAGAVDLSGGTTNVTRLAVSAAGQNVTLSEVDGFDIDAVAGVTGIAAGALAITTGGALTDTAATVANSLVIQAGGAVTLDVATNNVTTLQIDAGIHNIAYTDAGGFDIAGITGGAVVLRGAGAITDSGVITATGLGVQNTAHVTLNHAGSNVSSLAASTGSFNFSFADTDGFDIGVVGALSGIQGNVITLSAGGVVTDSSAIVATTLDLTATGDITLNHAANNLASLRISAAGLNVAYNDLNALDLQDVTAQRFTLSAGGAVTDSGRILVGDLGIQAAGAVTLNTANNNVDNLAVAAAANNVTFIDEDGFAIGTVGAYSGLTGGVITLGAGGAVSASTAISGTSLALSAGGDVTLNNVANSLSNLAVSAAGFDVAYRDTNALNIAVVGSVSGINAAALDLLVGGNLADTGAAALTIGGHTNIVSTTGTIALDAAANNFGTLSVSHVGNITSIVDANSLVITGLTRTSGTGTASISAVSGITVTGNVSTGALTLNADSNNDGAGIFTLNGGVSINSLSNANITISSGDLVLDGTISSGSGITTVQARGNNTIDLGNGGGGAYNISQAELNRITAGIIRVGGATSGAITVSSNISAANSSTLRLQGAGITATAGAIIENNLALHSTGAVTMTNTANDVTTLAISASGQSVSFYDADDLAISTVDSTTGASAGTLRLETLGNLTDAQALTGTSLAVVSTGTVTLDHASNNFTNVAFYAPGRAVRYNDANAVAINTVSGVTGAEAASLHITTTNGNITDSARSLVSGATTLSSGSGAITLDLGTNDFNTLTIASAGAVTIADANTLTLNNVTATGAVSIAGVSGLIVDGNVTVGGTLSLNADSNSDNNGTLRINTGRALSTAAANQAITLIGADLDIQGAGTVNSGTATTLLRTASTTRAVVIEGAGAVYNITQGEINAITAGILHIQSGTGASTLTLGGNITATGTDTLRLQAGTGGIDISGGAVTIANLALETSGGGNINATNAGNDVDNLAIQLATGTADFRDADSVNIATVAGITGLNTTMSAGAGRSVHIQAAGITDSSPSTVQNFGFTATASVVLDEASNNFAIIAGHAAGHDVTITDANALVIGQVTTLAPSTLTGLTAHNVVLNTGGALTDTHQSSISGNLSVNAAGQAVTLDHALNDFSAVTIGAAGNTRLVDANNLDIGAAAVSGTLDVEAYGNITITGDVTSAGNATFSADLDNNGTGIFGVNASHSVNSSGAALSVTAADLDLNGYLDSGVGNTTVTVSGGTAIGLGDTAADMSISKAELQRITAENLYIGGNLAGDIIVDNIALADLANIADSLYITALGNGADIHFVNNASFFKNVYGEADDSIFVDKDLTATVGQISLRADMDATPDPDGDQIYVTDGISIGSVGSSLFESTNGITIGQNINIFGDLIVNADTDNDGAGTLTLLNGYSIATNNYNLSLIAADLVLNGLVNAGTGRIQIEATNGRTIGLGDAAGDMQIGKAELQRLNAGTLYIGGTNTGHIMADNLSAFDMAGISGNVTLAALSAGAGISFNGNASSFGNSLSLRADNGVTLNHSVSASGMIDIDADDDDDGAGDLTIAATRTLASGDNDISVIANDVTLAGAIDSGTAQTSLQASDNAAIDLGGAGGGFNLSSSELDNITAGALRIGALAGGALSVSSDIAPAHTDTLALYSGGAITAAAGGIAVNNLALSAGGAITLTDTHTNIGTLAAYTTAGNITLHDADSLNVGAVAGLSGVATGGGNIALRLSDLEVVNAIAAGTGTVTLEGRDGNTIGLGGAGGDMNLRADELALITANTLHIGTAGAGALSVSADATLSGANRLALQTGGGVTATAGGLIVSDLDIAAGGAVVFTDISTNVDTLNVSAAGHSVTFFDSTNLSASLTASSADVAANNGLTLTASLAASGGVSLNADADNDGSGTFTLGPGLNIATGNNALMITANDIVLQAGSTLDAGTNIASIFVTNGGQINLGGSGAHMNLSNAELAALTAATLTLGNASAGAITIHDVLTHNAATLNLHSGGAITGTAGGLAVDTLNVSAGGAVNLTHASHDVDDLSVSAAGQTVSFHDANSLNLAGITAGSFNLTAAAVTDSAAITAASLSVTTSGAVTLDHAANDVSVLSIAAGASAVTYTDASGFDIAALSGGTVTLNAGGALSDSGTITAGTLNITSAGDVTLNTATNDADHLIVAAAGRAVTFRDAGGLNLAGITADSLALITGGAVSDSAATLANSLSVTASGAVTLDHAANDVSVLAIAAGSNAVTYTDATGFDIAGLDGGTVTLNASGALTDSGTITAGTLNITGIGDIMLDSATNDADHLSVAAAGRAVTFRDADGLNLAGITAGSFALNAGSAVTDSAAILVQNLNITSAGDVTLNEAASDIDNLFITATGRAVSFTDANSLNLAGITAGSLALTAGGAVTDSDAILANSLSVTTSGPVTLDHATNDTGILSIIAGTNAVTYNDASGFDIAALSGGAVSLNAGGALTDSGTITAGTLNITSTHDVTLDSAANDADHLSVAAAGRAVTFRDADGVNLAGITAGSFVLAAGGAVTDSAAILTNSLSVTASGAVTLDHAANDVSVLAIAAGSNAVTYTDATGFDIAGLGGGTVTLNASGALTDSGTITAGTLNIASTNDVTLDSATNDADHLSVAAAGRAVTFRDADGLNLAGITADSLALTAGGAVTDSAATAAHSLSVTASGSVVLDHGSNDVSVLTVAAGLNAVTYTDATGFDIAGLGGGTVALNAGGALSDSGAIAADMLNIAAAGDITLNGATNDVNHLAVAAAGRAVTFTDADGLNLAGLTAGSLNLTAGGAITDSAATIISGATVLAAGGAQDITLDDAGNDFGTLSVTVARYVTLADANALTLGPVTAATLHASAIDDLSVNGAIATTGAVTLYADAGYSGSGSFLIGSGSSISTASAAITITAADIDVDGTISSGAAVTTIMSGNGRTISLGGTGGDMAISDAELNAITASTLRIGDANAGNITVAGDIAPAHISALHLRTGGFITGTAGGIAVNALALSAGTGIDVADASTVVSSLAARTTAGHLHFANSGALGIASVDGLDGIAATAGNLTLQADDFAITQIIDNSGGITTLSGVAGGTISLGGAGGSMALSGSELNAITASTLRIGDAAAGDITVAADIAPSGVSTLHLRTGGTIAGTTGGIVVDHLALSAGTGINLTSASTAVSDLAATSAAGHINAVNNTALNVAAVDGISGIQATAGNVTLRAADLNITQALNNAGGITTLLGADGGTVSLGGAGGALSLSATDLNHVTAALLRIGDSATGNITLAGDIAPAGVTALHLRTNGAITGTAGGVAVNQLALSAGDAINMTDADHNVSTLAISAPGRSVSFHDADALVIGTVDGVSGAVASTLALSAGGGITDDAALAADTLTVAAGGDVILDMAANDVNNLSVAAAGHQVTVTDADNINLAGITASGFTLNTSGAVTDSAASAVSGTASIAAGAGHDVTLDDSSDWGAIAVLSGRNIVLNDMNALVLAASAVSGTLDVTAASGITVSGVVDAAGAANLNADSNDDGVGVFTVNGGQSLNTADAALFVTAADMALSGGIDSGTAVTTLSASRNGSIGLGAAADMQISAAEAAHITAAILRLGDAGTSALTVGDNMNFAGVDTLSLRSAGAVAGIGGGIAVNNLAINAGGAVTLGALSNDVNVLALSAAGQAVSYNDNNAFTVGTADAVAGLNAASLALSAGGALSAAAAINATDLNITATGAVNLGAVAHNVTHLAVSAAGQDVTFRDVSGLNLTGLNAQNATLVTDGAITDSGALVVADVLSLNAGAAHDITLDHAGHDLSTVTIISARDARIADGGSLTIGTSAVSGALHVQAQNNLTLAGTVQAGGAVDLVATPANNGIFTINGGATLSAPGQNVTVTAHDAALNGALDAGNGTLTMRSGIGAVWGVGTAAGQFALSGAELAQISAATFTIGGAGAGDILIENITAAQSAGIGNMVIQAYGDQSRIVFGPGAVSFRDLRAQADAEIRVNGALSATAGDMALDGDYDDFFDMGYANNVVYGPGASLFAQGALSAGGTTGVGVMQGPLGISTNGGDITLDRLGGAHSLTLSAGGAGDVTITGAIGGVVPVSSAVIRGNIVTGEIHAGALEIDANAAYLSGTVGGYTGEDAAFYVALAKKLPGPYLMNGFIVEGYVPPVPVVQNPVNTGGPSDPTSMQAPWIAAVAHGLEQRDNTIGDLVHQDTMRHPYIADILGRADAILTFSRDFFSAFFANGAKEVSDITVASSGPAPVEEDDQ